MHLSYGQLPSLVEQVVIISMSLHPRRSSTVNDRARLVKMNVFWVILGHTAPSGLSLDI